MTASPSSSANHRYLPRRRTAVDAPAGSTAREIGGAGAGGGGPRAGGAPGRRRCAGRPSRWLRPRRTTSTSGSSGTGPEGRVIRVGSAGGFGPRSRLFAGESAAALLLGFFLGPAGADAAAAPARITCAVNSFAWSGPSSADRYRDAEPESADSSCSEVFQSRPAPSCGAALEQVGEQPVDHARAVSRPCWK